ncbi:hypothetical protein I7I53_01998 [Histoplasma capsulatum var. duboisii H88]|uniref:Uncharacterized protein n=1 Tax=Ajellomyces capsulatus (strain H88) TaxID=544711 RepID=A0A8A1LKS0_AJEC8|nr:hypothetical protein I7I53_01998 [Histoplasma capsulatum var. duboisii H88]
MAILSYPLKEAAAATEEEEERRRKAKPRERDKLQAQTTSVTPPAHPSLSFRTMAQLNFSSDHPGDTSFFQTSYIIKKPYPRPPQQDRLDRLNENKKHLNSRITWDPPIPECRMQFLPEDAGRIPCCWDLEELGWGLIVCVCVCVAKKYSTNQTRECRFSFRYCTL